VDLEQVQSVVTVARHVGAMKVRGGYIVVRQLDAMNYPDGYRVELIEHSA
jgi:hypothetical protein